MVGFMESYIIDAKNLADGSTYPNALKNVSDHM